MSDTDPKMIMPVQWQVTVSQHLPTGPNPVLSIYFLEGGSCRLAGNAGQGFAPLLESTKKVVAQLALTTMREQLEQELHGTTADGGQDL